MRSLFAAALALGVLVILPGRASALTVTPDPLNFQIAGLFGPDTIGSIDFLDSSTETRVDMQITTTQGKVRMALVAACPTPDCGLFNLTLDTRDPSGTSTTPGPGVDVWKHSVTQIKGAGWGFFNFQYDQFPGTTDVFSLEFLNDPLQAGDTLYFLLAGEKPWKFTTVSATVPEPATLLLLGLGLGGLVLAGGRPEHA